VPQRTWGFAGSTNAWFATPVRGGEPTPGTRSSCRSANRVVRAINATRLGIATPLCFRQLLGWLAGTHRGPLAPPGTGRVDIVDVELQVQFMKTITMLELRRDSRRWLEAVRNGERFILTFRGQPVARLEPVELEPTHVPADDPLLRIDDFAVDGAGGDLDNEEIDRVVYGS